MRDEELTAIRSLLEVDPDVAGFGNAAHAALSDCVAEVVRQREVIAKLHTDIANMSVVTSAALRRTSERAMGDEVVAMLRLPMAASRFAQLGLLVAEEWPDAKLGDIDGTVLEFILPTTTRPAGR